MKLVAAVLTAALSLQSTNAADGVVKANLRGDLRNEWVRATQAGAPVMLEEGPDVTTGSVAFKSIFSVGQEFNGYYPPGIVSD